MFDQLSSWARALKRDALALYLAARDQRTPWYAKAFAAAIVAYAFSPIDLIPDFIPVLGYLDDAIILPLGIWVAIRMIPDEVMDEHRARAAELAERPVNRAAAVVIVLIWFAAAAAAVWWVCGVVSGG